MASSAVCTLTVSLFPSTAAALPCGRRRPAAPLAALAGFNFFTSEYTASREELQAQVAKRFPVRQRYAEIFTVSLRDPQLALDARSNRAAITRCSPSPARCCSRRRSKASSR